MRNEIVVGLDESPSSKAALDWAVEQAKSAGAVLRAVHALDWPTGLSATGFPAPVNLMDVSRDELHESYRQKITALFDAVSPRPEWILQVASGDAGEVLVQQSKDARLLVVGTREHVGLARMWSGSVSHYCLSHAECPVVAVPASTADRGAEDAEAAKIHAAESRIEQPGAPSPTLVVVGVDASAESLAAARYAVMAAEMRRCDVSLVHAFLPPSARTSETAEKLLATVASQLVVPPHVHLYSQAEPRDATVVLADAARRARMLVLGRDHVSWGERLLMGAITSQIAGHVDCPLIVVPSGWHPRQAWPPQPVVVALDGETAAKPVLNLAFEEAMLRHTRLVVLHAEPMSASDRDVTAARLDLEILLAGWKQDHPHVAISTAIVSGDADAQLVRWSRSAAVLVVGRPHQHGWGSWILSVARSVMRQTHCPLIIAPQATPESRRQRALADQATTTG
jgi:nucleotide-binding universal stress UspA family protein